MSPPDELDKYDELKLEIRKQMELIRKYYDGINTPSLCIQKELQNLNYLLELKKSKSISNLPEEDKQI